jgi:hypothetical protein
MRPITMRRLSALVISIAVAGLWAASARAAAPNNTSPPTITGTLMQGKTLTATKGTWSNSPTTFFYRWQRCSADGTACANIDNAAQGTYRLTATDVDNTMRVVVTASNADGQTAANSKVSDVVSATTAPKNAVKPSISGTARPGEELTAANGTWTGGVRTFAYQWQRCDTAGANCTEVAGATGKTYGVRGIDVDHTLRVVVTATNLAGSTNASSDNSAIVKSATTPPPTGGTVNRRPTIVILSVRFVGARVYARFRVCDDSRRNVNIIQRDSKPRVPSYTRRFRTLVPPRNCAALTRNWLPAQRFRHGRYTLTLTARDALGLTSLRPARRTFFR